MCIRDRIKVETTFDGTRVNPEKSGSITQVSSENFTPEDFCYGVLKYLKWMKRGSYTL